MSVIYDIQQLVKQYPEQANPANNEITLQIHQGEIFGLLGDNGAGKSTLVKQMVNLVTPTSGSIHFMGSPIDHDPLRIPTHVGYMPQDGLALNSLTVAEALFFTAHLCGLSFYDAKEERERLIRLWDINHLRDKTPKQLSGGQRRLMQLAVTMVGSPPVLIFDEPTNDLDPQRRRYVWEVLRQTNRTQGSTIIFITHDAIEAEKIIQRVGIMQAGKMVALGKPSELKQQLNKQLRLELFLSTESYAHPALPPRPHPALTPQPPLPRGEGEQTVLTLPLGEGELLLGRLECVELDAGRWLIFLDKEDVPALFQQLDLEQVDDFRLYSATLEDLYLHYSGM